MREEILAMLKELRPENDFESSADFFEDALLDSFDLLSLISMLEEKYGIQVDGLDIVPENFMDVDAIIALVGKSRKGN